MSLKSEIDASEFDGDELRAPFASEAVAGAQSTQKKPEGRLTADVIQRSKDLARVHLARKRTETRLEMDLPNEDGPPDLNASSTAAMATKSMLANLSFGGPSLRHGVSIFIVVYVIGFFAVLGALDLFPDLIQLMFGPQGGPPAAR